MTADVLPGAITEAEPYDVMLTREARQVFRNAVNTSPTWDGNRVIGNAVLDLAGALRDYSGLVNGILPAHFPGLAAGPEARARALRWAAETAQEKAAEVTRLILAAEYADGKKGEQ